MMQYECEKCGGLMLYTVLTCIPPIHQYTCQKCGRVHEERDDVFVVKK